MVTPIPVESDFEVASIGGIRGVGKGGVSGTTNAVFAKKKNLSISFARSRGSPNCQNR